MAIQTMRPAVLAFAELIERELPHTVQPDRGDFTPWLWSEQLDASVAVLQGMLARRAMADEGEPVDSEQAVTEAAVKVATRAFVMLDLLGILEAE